MRITIEIPDDRLSDALDEASPACAHWADRFERGQGLISLRVRERKTQQWFDCDVAKGLAALALAKPERLADLMSDEHWDELAVDALVQCCCFGGLRY